jgi:hypothetical protein
MRMDESAAQDRELYYTLYLEQTALKTTMQTPNLSAQRLKELQARLDKCLDTMTVVGWRLYGRVANAESSQS